MRRPLSNAKYRKVADEIVADIRSKKLLPGDRVPTVRDLESKHSNSTARNALRWLRENGWVVTAPGGAGSFVADPLPQAQPTLEERVTALEAWRREVETASRPDD